MEYKILEIEKNVLLKNYTTFKIGGKAKYFFVAKNKEKFLQAIDFSKKKKIPILIIGGGSNLLISDEGFNGLVIKMAMNDIIFKDNQVFAGAGASLSRLAHLCGEKGLAGLEWSMGIPSATLGGTIYGHAQAFGNRISDIVKSVEVFDFKKNRFLNFSKKQCQFSLKNSAFKKNKNLLIISAFLEFEKRKPEEIKNKIKEVLKYRKAHHPLLPSAGSVFVNPEKKITKKSVLKEFPEIIEYNKKGVIPAGYLIQKCGLVGKRIGGAEISKKHCNFIVNIGNAKAKNVLALIKLAQKKVKEKFGIKLKPEIQII